MFGWLKKEKKTASVAKDRLTIAIMSDRNSLKDFPFMDELKAEVLELVKKYIGVKSVDIKKEVDGDIEALSIDIQLEKKEEPKERKVPKNKERILKNKEKFLKKNK